MAGPLRSDLLAGITVIVAGDAEPGPGPGAEPGPGPVLTARLAALGAQLIPFTPTLDDAGEGGAAWVGAQPVASGLVYDSRPGWRASGAGIDRLRRGLDAAWVACAAAANGAFIPSGQGGRIVLIGPGARAGELAGAAGDGLENLARTLSIEWARFGITITTIVPARSGPSDPDGADDANDADLATLIAFLLSKAGGYFSGTRLDLGGVSG